MYGSDVLEVDEYDFYMCLSIKARQGHKYVNGIRMETSAPFLGRSVVARHARASPQIMLSRCAFPYK